MLPALDDYKNLLENAWIDIALKQGLIDKRPFNLDPHGYKPDLVDETYAEHDALVSFILQNAKADNVHNFYKGITSASARREAIDTFASACAVAYYRLTQQPPPNGPWIDDLTTEGAVYGLRYVIKGGARRGWWHYSPPKPKKRSWWDKMDKNVAKGDLQMIKSHFRSCMSPRH